MAREKTKVKSLVLWIGCLLVSAALVGFGVYRYLDKSLGSVNGKQICAEELQMYAERERALVAAEYSQKYQLSEIGKSFWNSDFDGHTPSETLLERTMEKLVYFKVLAQQCSAEGIKVPKDYVQLKQETEAENERRKQAFSQEKVVYGIPEYTVEQYHDYVMSTARTQLMEKLLQGKMAPTEEQLRQAYEKVDDRYKHQDFFCKGWIIRWTTKTNPQETMNEIKAAIREKGVKQAKQELSMQIEGLVMEEFVLDTKKVHREDAASIQMAEQLFDVQKGEFLGVSEDGMITVYYLEEKEGGGLISFEQAPRLAQNQYINDAFEAYMNEKIEQAKVKLDFKKAIEILENA